LIGAAGFRDAFLRFGLKNLQTMLLPEARFVSKTLTFHYVVSVTPKNGLRVG